ncbi:CHAD domain-containing protein [Leifsonia sp. NPDC058230]|uniref:CHAD domain-containing protein n=1 Tax=Leifsonia sp. NPDC058230 TaxID=3346391 RepID=UPI0036D9B829
MFALIRLSAELSEQLIAVELGGEDAVHQARTRVRRLRSVLSVYRRAFNKAAANDLRHRLRSLGHALGDARDLEVRARSLEDLLAAETAPDVVDAVLGFAEEAHRGYEAAERSLLAHLRARPHRILLADLQEFAAVPPLRKRATKHPDDLIETALDNALDRVRHGGSDTLEERHQLRKAARRLRYAAEAVSDTRDVSEVAAAAEDVQDAFGDNRDLILLARHLRERASATELSASATAGIARLALVTETAAAERLSDADPALRALREV